MALILPAVYLSISFHWPSTYPGSATILDPVVAAKGPAAVLYPLDQ
ncbi:MAG: hypothetical protein ACOYLI_02645 [Synechococcus lacustris]